VPRYPGLQHSSKLFDSLRSGSWEGKDICGIIRTMVVNCAPILVCSKDDGKTAAENDFDDVVIRAVQVLCQLSLLVSKQNHSDLSAKCETMHSGNYTRRTPFCENRKCGSLRRPMWMNCWQQNPISHTKKRFIGFVLQWRPLCMGRKRFPQHNVGTLRSA